MSVFTTYQAIPVNLLEKLQQDNKLLLMTEQLWSCGNGMFYWFHELVEDGELEEIAESWIFEDSPFSTEDEVNKHIKLYSLLLETIKKDDPGIADRSASFEKSHDAIAFLVEKGLSEFQDSVSAKEIDFIMHANCYKLGKNTDEFYMGLFYSTSAEVKQIATQLEKFNVDALLQKYGLPGEFNQADWKQEIGRELNFYITCMVEAAKRNQILVFG